MAFPDTDSLERWAAGQQQIIRKNRSVWYGWQYTAALVDVEAKRLAALRELKKDDPTFDIGLERVRSISRIKSIYNAWGPLSDGVLKEVDAYLATNPSAEGQSEAQYRAGLAIYCREHPNESTNPAWASAVQSARARLAQVQPGTKLQGAATAWQIMFDLIEAGTNKETVLPKVREFAQKYKSDEPAMQIAGSFFQTDMLASLWPIPIEAVDIDNKPVTLDQYKGRVVLVDFWATWCGPCRGELPGMLAAYQKYHDQGFDVLSISLDYADKTTPEAYRIWIADKGMNWRHVYDQQDWNGPLVKAYLVRGIPSPVLVGRDGSLVAMGEDCRGDKLPGSIEKALAKAGV
jgi:thiol-disulfide isomerase/thioredoxin